MKTIDVKENLKKDITFYCEDIIEEHLIEPLLKKFDSNNYKVKISNDFNSASEIGYYCSPSNNIRNIKSKFSIISLGGMDQGKLYWPNFWFKESWSRFDLGVLPGKNWSSMWKKYSWYTNARTKYAISETGWPKTFFLKKNKKSIPRLINKFNILYAPCFETDNKGIEIVNIIKDLDVNLIIKHLPWRNPSEKVQFKDIRSNISNMIKYAKKNLKNKVYIISSKENIFDYFGNADLLITDESSLIYEALLFEIPIVSCSDWVMRVNNINIPRKIQKDHNACIYVGKKKLKKKIIEIKNNYNKFKNLISEKKNMHFSHIENSIDIIFSLINEIVEKNQITNFIKPTYKKNKYFSLIYNYLKFYKEKLKKVLRILSYRYLKIIYF